MTPGGDAALALLVASLALINIVTWACYRIDKRRAGRGRWRISERVLLGLALAGGSIGAMFAVYAHARRHKANKRRFMLALWAIVLCHVALAGWWLVRAWDPLR